MRRPPLLALALALAAAACGGRTTVDDLVGGPLAPAAPPSPAAAGPADASAEAAAPDAADAGAPDVDPFAAFASACASGVATIDRGASPACGACLKKAIGGACRAIFDRTDARDGECGAANGCALDQCPCPIGTCSASVCGCRAGCLAGAPASCLDAWTERFACLVDACGSRC